MEIRDDDSLSRILAKDAKPLILPGADADRARQLAAPRPRRAKVKQTAPVPFRAANGLRAGPLPLPASAKPPRQRAPKRKNDPKYVAAARELRDRYLEEFNGGNILPGAAAKYDISRALTCEPPPPLQLPAATGAAAATAATAA